MGTWGIFRTGATVVTAVGFALVIAGCATQQTDAAGPATSTPTAAPTPMPTATPTPTPTPEPVATCETVLTDAEYASLDEDGLAFTGETHLGATLQSLVDAGGISCHWVAPRTDVMAYYAQWPSDEESWDALRADLLSRGATEIVDPLPGIIQDVPDPERQPSYIYRDGIVHYVSNAKLFSSVLALQ